MIDHEIISMATLPILLVQKGQLSVLLTVVLVNRLEGRDTPPWNSMSRIRPAGHNLNSVGWAVKPQTNKSYLLCIYILRVGGLRQESKIDDIRLL